MYSNDEVADVLEKAADYIHIHGHYKGYYAKDETVCTEGAIFYATGTSLENLQRNAKGALCVHSLAYPVFTKLVEYLGLDVDYITMWNDAPERTQEEVEDTLKNCAKELRNQV